MGRCTNVAGSLGRLLYERAFAGALVGFALLMLQAGCAGGGLHGGGSSGNPIPTGSQPMGAVRTLHHAPSRLPWVRADAPWFPLRMRSRIVDGWHRDNVTKSGMVYASDYNNNVINCYSAKGFNQQLAGTISSGLENPQGMSERGSSITVANTGASNVRVYNGCNAQPTRTMDDSSGYPLDVAIDRKGNTYVTNILDVGSSNGEVRRYSPKNNVGIRIGDENLVRVYFVAVDAAGDVFVDGLNALDLGEVDWLPAGLGTEWKDTHLPLLFPGGLGFDKSGNIVIDDQEAGTFTAYSVPQLKPTGTSFYCPGGHCVSFAFNKQGDEMWIASGITNVIWGVRYPQGTAEDVISDGFNVQSLVIGVTATAK